MGGPALQAPGVHDGAGESGPLWRCTVCGSRVPVEDGENEFYKLQFPLSLGKHHVDWRSRDPTISLGQYAVYSNRPVVSRVERMQPECLQFPVQPFSARSRCTADLLRK